MQKHVLTLSILVAAGLPIAFGVPAKHVNPYTGLPVAPEYEEELKECEPSSCDREEEREIFEEDRESPWIVSVGIPGLTIGIPISF